MKYTVSEFIELLNKFPEDLPIETDLSLMWNYPEELKSKKDSMADEEFVRYTQENATDLCIFEGSWERGNISDVDGKLEKYLRRY
ncbi:MAG: hypothetical protein IJF83_00020 [Methanobrevibacter sp.]|nr:hypothetical protein [Methanobrevibacter sp.]